MLTTHMPSWMCFKVQTGATQKVADFSRELQKEVWRFSLLQFVGVVPVRGAPV